jgi:hypothetical protein
VSREEGEALHEVRAWCRSGEACYGVIAPTDSWAMEDSCANSVAENVRPPGARSVDRNRRPQRPRRLVAARYDIAPVWSHRPPGVSRAVRSCCGNLSSVIRKRTVNRLRAVAARENDVRSCEPWSYAFKKVRAS